MSMFFRCDGGCGAETPLVFTGDGWLVVAIDGAAHAFLQSRVPAGLFTSRRR